MIGLVTKRRNKMPKIKVATIGGKSKKLSEVFVDPSPKIIKQAIKDWNQLALAIHKLKTIDDVIDSRFDTSNFCDNEVDISYKSICTTAFECNGFIALSTEVECGEHGYFFNIDLMRYSHPVRMLGAYRDEEV